MDQFILPFVAGAALTALISWLICRNLLQKRSLPVEEKLQQQVLAITQLQSERNELQNQKETLLGRSAAAESRNAFLQEQYLLYGQLQQEHQQVQNKLTSTESALKNAEEKLLKQLEEMNNIGEKFKFEFRNLAQSIMEEKSKVHRSE